MKCKTLGLRAGSMCLVAGLSLSAQASVVFDADFTGSPLPDDSGTRDLNVSAADLNAGTAVGSWSFDGSATDAGVLNAGNNALTSPSLSLDDVEGDVTVLTGAFSSAGDIGSGNTVTYAWDWAVSRGGGNKDYVFSALSGGTAAYQISWQASTRNVFWVDTDGDSHLIANLNATSYFQGSKVLRNANNDLGVELLITDGGVDNGDGTGTGATISLDTDNDGIFDVISVIGPSTAGLTSLDGLSFALEGTGTNRGQRIAEVSAVSIVPEPSSLALAITGAACMLWRRRAQ